MVGIVLDDDVIGTENGSEEFEAHWCRSTIGD
jgi:hypothetical protein